MRTQNHCRPQYVFPHCRPNRLKTVQTEIDSTPLTNVAVVGRPYKLNAPLLCPVHRQSVFFAFQAGEGVTNGISFTDLEAAGLSVLTDSDNGNFEVADAQFDDGGKIAVTMKNTALDQGDVVTLSADLLGFKAKGTELANGAEKYLPTPEHHELGGYETWLGTNQVERQASVKITAALLDLLAEVAPEAR